jgi:hypothetical protein
LWPLNAETNFGFPLNLEENICAQVVKKELSIDTIFGPFFEVEEDSPTRYWIEKLINSCWFWWKPLVQSKKSF